MNRQINKRRNGGFTIIELTLSMTFVSVLLLAIAMTVIQIATIYNRGMTLKEVNQSSRDISDELRRGFTSSATFMINADDTDSTDYIRVRSGSTVVGGRLCTGKDSYIWNIGAAVDRVVSGSPSPMANVTRVVSAGGAVGDPIRFVKVPDSNKKYCLKTGSLPTNRNIVDADVRQMTDLLDAGDHKLALQTFDVRTTDGVYDASTRQRLYTVTYTLSSGEPSAMNLTARPIKCLEPGTANSNLTYCNVQEFTIVLRVGNMVEEK